LGVARRTWRGVSSVVVPYLMVSMFLFFLSCSLIVPKYQPSLTVPLKYRPSAACPTRFAPDTGGLIGHLAAFHIHAQHRLGGAAVEGRELPAEVGLADDVRHRKEARKHPGASSGTVSEFARGGGGREGSRR